MDICCWSYSVPKIIVLLLVGPEEKNNDDVTSRTLKRIISRQKQTSAKNNVISPAICDRQHRSIGKSQEGQSANGVGENLLDSR